MAASTSCILCDIVAGRAPGSIIFRDGLVCAFMDIQPVNPGHLLIVPIEHSAYLADLDPATGGRMFEVGQQLAAALRRTELKCEGINFFLADGEAAGQEVFHAHLHVFPRFAGDGFGLRYGPDYTKLPPRSALEEVAATVRRALSP